VTDAIAAAMPALTRLHTPANAATVIGLCCADRVATSTLVGVVEYVLTQPWAPDWATYRLLWFDVIEQAGKRRNDRLVDLATGVRPPRA
jgi:hypothetical protein